MKEKAMLNIKNANATLLIRDPHLSNDQGRGSSSSLRKRFNRMAPMDIIYEKRRPALERLMIAFKATSEPKLRAEMRSDTTRTTMRELTGISQLGRT